MAKTSRAEYVSHLSRVYNHLDWYLEQIFKNRTTTKLPLPRIRADLRDSTHVKIRAETICRYNAKQFSCYQTAPLEWIGDNMFRLNNNYYRLLHDKVFEPRIGKFGPPKKYTKDEASLYYQI